MAQKLAAGVQSLITQNPGVIGTSFVFVATQVTTAIPFITDLSTARHHARRGSGHRNAANSRHHDSGRQLIFVATRQRDISRYTIKSTHSDGCYSTGFYRANSNPVLCDGRRGKLLFVLNEGPLAAPMPAPSQHLPSRPARP